MQRYRREKEEHTFRFKTSVGRQVAKVIEGWKNHDFRIQTIFYKLGAKVSRSEKKAYPGL